MNRLGSSRARAATIAVAAIASMMILFSSTLVTAGASRDGAGIAAVRAATSRYHDVNQALADGYVPVSPCIEAPGLGVMGIHYLNPALASDLTIDARAPEILLYVPSDSGLRLVGVEYWSIALANTADGPAPWFGPTAPAGGFVNPAPVVLGVQFEGPMEGHDPGMPWHYDRHLWIWQANTAGIFEQFNPKVSC